jgi:alpha-aminoadipate carrier protein LysW
MLEKRVVVMNQIRCTECDAEIRIPNDAIQGEVISCQDCGATYELVKDSTGLFTIRPAELEQEDWGE